MPEIRLVFQCGHGERWETFQQLEPEEIVSTVACIDCQRQAAGVSQPDRSLEELAEADLAMRRGRRHRTPRA